MGKFKRIFKTILIISLVLTLIPISDITCNAAAYYKSGDWSNGWSWWSQSQSKYADMRDYGCYLVAKAKMLVLAGIADNNSSTFNPDIYYEWELSKGYTNSEMYATTYAAPQYYADSKGKKLTYEGMVSGNNTNKVWDNINAGKYTILRVYCPDSHYILVNNDASKQTGKIRIFQSWAGNYDPPGTRDLTDSISQILTYSVNSSSSGSSSSNRCPEYALSICEPSNGKLHIKGWAYDPDDDSAKVVVQVNIGGDWNSNNAEHIKITANKTEANGHTHGFDEYISTNKRGVQDIYMYALDNTGNGDYNTYMGKYTVNFSIPAKPTLIASSTTCDVTDGIDLTWGSVSGATKYVIDIWKDGKQYLNKDIGNVYKYHFSGMTAGTYDCFVRAANSNGSTASDCLHIQAVNPYIISYNANGGSGAPSSQSKKYGTTLTLSTTQPTRTGYTFKNWNTKADGSGTSYASGASYTANSAVTLYAQWTINTYTDTIYYWAWGFYHGEGNNGNKNAFNISTNTINVKYNENKKIDSSYIKEIRGFSCNNEFGSAGFSSDWTTYQMPYTFLQPAKNIGIEINYWPIKYKINYDLDGGVNNPNNPTQYNILYGVTFKEPTKDGFIFKGWIDGSGNKITGINENCNASFASVDDFYNAVDKRTIGDVTIKADWEKILASTKTTVTKKPTYSLLDIAVKNADIGTTVVAAMYNQGRLVDLQTEIYDGNDISLATFSKYDEIKVMIWKDLSTLKPLGNTEIIKN